jgi:hypothetical protein
LCIVECGMTRSASYCAPRRIRVSSADRATNRIAGLSSFGPPALEVVFDSKSVLCVVLAVFALAPDSYGRQRRPREKANAAAPPSAAAPRVPLARSPGGDAKSEPLPTAVTLEAARALFQTADANLDGKVDAGEAASAGLGPRDCNAADKSGDRLLDADEFVIGTCAMLARLDRPIADDLRDGAAKLAAELAKPRAAVAIPADAAAVPANAPRAQDRPRMAAPKTPGDAKRQLEGKIAEVLGEATDPAVAGQALRERAAQADGTTGASASDRARADLNRRMRRGEVDPTTAAAERERLESRIANAAKSAAVAAEQATAPANAVESTSPPPTDVVSTPAMAPTEPELRADDAPEVELPAAPADQAKQLREALEQRILADGVDETVAAERRAKLEKRLASMGKRKAANEAAPSEPEPPADLAGLSPVPDAAPIASDAAPADRSKLMRDTLEQRLADGQADEATAKVRREKLERRLRAAEKRAANERATEGDAASGEAAGEPPADATRPARDAKRQRGQNKPKGSASPDAGVKPAEKRPEAIPPGGATNSSGATKPGG